MIYILITPFFSFILSFFSDKKAQDNEIIDIYKHPFYLTFCYGFGELLNGIPFLIEYISNTKNYANSIKLKEHITINTMKVISNNNKCKKKLILFSMVSLCTVLNKIAFSFLFINVSNQPSDFQVQSQFVVFQVVFGGLLSYFIIHYPIYHIKFYQFYL